MRPAPCPRKARRCGCPLAFGQIVCTLTTRPGILWATFTRGGQRVEVPRGDGSLTADPLNAASYSRLMAAG